jgi:hypothetical protein
VKAGRKARLFLDSLRAPHRKIQTLPLMNADHIDKNPKNLFLITAISVYQR